MRSCLFCLAAAVAAAADLLLTLTATLADPMTSMATGDDLAALCGDLGMLPPSRLPGTSYQWPWTDGSITVG